MKLETAKGVRDIKPEEKLLREYVINILKEVFELYGFMPLETPIIERYDVLASKYAGGEEILKEIFKFKDQGNRSLGLRYDLTVPFARFIGMNPNLKVPFKRYEIGSVFRDGPLGKGRLRQFTQCDVDVVGSKSLMADAEFIEMANFVFKRLDLNVVVRVNNRKILDKIMEKSGVKKDMINSAILSVDKLDKIGVKGVKKELLEKGIKEDSIKRILKLISIRGSNKEKLEYLRKELGKCEGLDEIEGIMKFYNDFVFDVSLARGLSYYTGTIYEVYLKNKEVSVSLAAGGRYDSMIGSFIGKGEYPAVGISFGLDRIVLALKKKKIGPLIKVYVIPIKTKEKAYEIVRKIRSSGINCDIDLSDRGISKNLSYANYLGVPYVIFVGKKELEKGVIKLRDMKTGKEKEISLEECIKILKRD
jgi:histidyl-tRNA synthetase